tara:strand:- start:229 stop:747 length:519 start_codon:yes stop_codon:yes gene_type:complete
MPRIGYIYEIKSMDTSITGTYIGSCWDMKDRLRRHADSCYNENNKDYNYPVYKYIRENGDFHTFTMRVIDSGECEDLTELVCGEQFYIDMAGGIENLLNGKDAFVLPEENKKRKNIARDISRKKNVETKRFPCNLCGFYFRNNCELQEHLNRPSHKKKAATYLTIEDSDSTK